MTNNKTKQPEIYGLIPPQAIEIEEAVLGAMLIEKDATAKGIGLISNSDMFYNNSNKLIFEAIRDISNRFDNVDLLMVVKELQKNGNIEKVGGAYYLSGLTTKVNLGTHIETHIRVLLQMWIRRILIQISFNYQKTANDMTIDEFDILGKAQFELNKISNVLQTKKAESTQRLYIKAIEEIETAVNSSENKGLTGVPSGFLEIDKITGGWQNTDLIIIAGRPGMGKTTFALNAIRNAIIDHDRKVALFSLEMGATQLVKKLISIETQFSTSQLVKGNLEKSDISIVKSESYNLYYNGNKLYIDDSATLSMQQLKSKCVILKQKENINMIVVDYLQLLSTDNKNKEQELSEISRGLKQIAKELDVPVIALAQLSRSVETRGNDKKPQLSDLRGSGSIEQDADIVAFIYRPEYYNINEYEDGTSTIDTAEFLISKNRNGSLADVRIGCKLKYSKFYDIKENDNNFGGINGSRSFEAGF